MTDKKRSSGLGRGLSALLDEVEGPAQDAQPELKGGVEFVPLSRISPNPDQPRRFFDQQALSELAESIRRQGVLQPLLVRSHGNGHFEIIAGERRWRAAQAAQVHEVPVLIRDLDEGAALEVALIENIQRQDLNPIEEASGFQRLMADFSYTQEAVGRFVGKSRSHVANMLRLLGLPTTVRELIAEGRLTMGHARALVSTPDPEGLAQRVVDEGLSVRQTEQLASRTTAPSGSSRPGTSARTGRGKDPDIAALESQVSDLLGLKVTIDHRGSGGQLAVDYGDLGQLDMVLQRLSDGRI